MDNVVVEVAEDQGLSFVIDRSSGGVDQVVLDQQQEKNNFFNVLTNDTTTATTTTTHKSKINQQGFAKNFVSNCFNCSGSGHGVYACPYIHNQYIINERKKAFTRKSKFKKSSRYFLNDLQESTDSTTTTTRQLFPDVRLSAETRNAMGLSPYQLPHFIYRMRFFGYPPAYRQKCLEISQPLIPNLPRGPHDDAQWTIEEESWSNEIEVWINPDFIIHFEGFNSPPAPNIIDESGLYNCPTYESVEHLHSKKAFIQAATAELLNWAQNVRFHRQNLHRIRSWARTGGPVSGAVGVKRPLSTTSAVEDQTDSDSVKRPKLDIDDETDKLKGPNSTTENSKNSKNTAGKLPELFNFSKNYPETFGLHHLDSNIEDNLDLNLHDDKSDNYPENCSLHENTTTTTTNSQKNDVNNAFLESGDWTKIIQKMKKPPLESFTCGIEEPLLLPDIIEPTGRLSKILNQIMLFKKKSTN